LLTFCEEQVWISGRIKAPRAIGGIEVQCIREIIPVSGSDFVDVALGNGHELANTADQESLVGNVDVCDRQRVAIDIRDTSEELISREVQAGVFLNAGEDQLSGTSDRGVVAASEGDVKGALADSAIAVSDGVVNGDGLSVVSSE